MSTRDPSNPMGRLGSAIWQLIQEWWRADRIRASPREGRWLRLQVGDGFRFAGQWWEITARHAPDASPRPVLRYECRSGERFACLVFELNEADSFHWQSAGSSQVCSLDQLDFL